MIKTSEFIKTVLWCKHVLSAVNIILILCSPIEHAEGIIVTNVAYRTGNVDSMARNAAYDDHTTPQVSEHGARLNQAHSYEYMDLLL